MSNPSPSALLISIMADMDEAADLTHQLYGQFYRNPITDKPIPDTLELRATKIALMHSELSEMLEGVRKGKPDSHIPELTSEEVELADLLIRAFDYAGWRQLRLSEALQKKLHYNSKREDHVQTNRAAEGGKKI